MDYMEPSEADVEEYVNTAGGIDNPIIGRCAVCNGTGRNPMSDNVNWLPCAECNGTGRKRRV